MIKNFRLIAIFLLFWRCSSSTDELGNYFEPTHIEELNKLTEFVVNELTADCEGSQTDCLEAHFNQFKGSGYDFEITAISQSKQSQFLNTLSKSTYNEIWSTCRGTRSFSPDSIVNIESICLNTNGAFAKFLTTYCSNNKRLADYGYAFEQAGDYTPSMNSQLLKHPSTFNLNTKAELLLISIHLLTLNNEEKIIDSVPKKP